MLHVQNERQVDIMVIWAHVCKTSTAKPRTVYDFKVTSHLVLQKGKWCTVKELLHNALTQHNPHKDPCAEVLAKLTYIANQLQVHADPRPAYGIFFFASLFYISETLLSEITLVGISENCQ